jgi:hypothetical protein
VLTDRQTGRFVVVRIDLGEVSENTATKMGDQLVAFAGAVGKRAAIIEEGSTSNAGTIVCPDCGNDSFQEHGTMRFKQPVSLKRREDGVLEIDNYISASEPLDELSEPAGIECSQCLHALDVRGYDPKDLERHRRIARLIDGHSRTAEDPDSDLTDALTDILRLAASRGFKVGELTERALSRFNSESQQDRWVTCSPNDILDVQCDAMSVTAGASLFSAEEVNEQTGTIRFVVIESGGVGKYYEVDKDGSVTARGD